LPAACGGGQEKTTARGQKISSPKTPPFFARSPEKFFENTGLIPIVVFCSNL